MLLAQVLIVAFLVMLLVQTVMPVRTAPAQHSTGLTLLHSGLDRAQLPALIGLALGLLSLVLGPSGVSPALALRGLWGDPSVTSLQLLVLALLGRAPASLTHGWRAPAVIAAVALLLYPFALGATDFDPYRLGYAPWLLVLPLGIAALARWWRGDALWLWLLAIDLLAWAAGLLESPNLWDTLLDPLLALACLILAARNGWRIYRRTT